MVTGSILMLPWGSLGTVPVMPWAIGMPAASALGGLWQTALSNEGESPVFSQPSSWLLFLSCLFCWKLFRPEQSFAINSCFVVYILPHPRWARPHSLQLFLKCQFLRAVFPDCLI